MTQTANLSCNEVWGGHGLADNRIELPGMRGLVFSSPYRNARAGGDVHYVSSCGTGRITRVMLADVMGHGDDAAEVAAYLRSLMRRYVNHIQPHDLASDVNDLFAEHVQHQGAFATAVILTFFAPTGELSLCNAGHPPPIVHRHDSGRWQPLHRLDQSQQPSNLPLGVDQAGRYEAFNLFLQPGDQVMLYTDGLIEATNAAHEQLSVAGLVDLLNDLHQSQQNLEPDDTGHATLQAIKSRGYTLDADDLSLVVLQCQGRSNGRGIAPRLAGMAIILRNLLAGRGMSWPEWSLRNIGGALFPPLSRLGSPPRDRP